MAGGLRKIGGKDSVGGWYSASGTLAGITGPGRRTVEVLEIRRLGPGEDLSVLCRFPDLWSIEFDHIQGVDLARLADFAGRRVMFRNASDLDLAPIAGMRQLEDLILLNFEDVRIPPTFGPAMSHLAFVNDDPDLSGEPVRQAIEAIDWPRMSTLRGLDLRVGGLYERRPIEVDLGFLRFLPLLQRLDMYRGIRHAASSPSPIEPPFDGLSKHLAWTRIDADEPERVQRALCAYLGVGVEAESRPNVRQRYPYEEPAAPWSISATPDGDGWHVYGSLAREERGSHDDVTEYDALRRAKGRLRAADPALVRRLDFDPESAGTGIMAARREDLERALEILRLRT